MTFGWIRSPRYSASLIATAPQWATWMASRRIRMLSLLVLVAIVLILLSSLMDVSSQIHNFSAQEVYGSFKTDPPLDSDRLDLQHTPENSETTTLSPPPSQTTRPGGDSGQTGNQAQNVKISDKPTDIQESQAEQPQAQSQAQPPSEMINWSSFAYVQYVTNSNYLCSSLMILEALHRLGTQADRIMMYPEQWEVSATIEGTTEEARFLIQARDQYKAKLIPIRVVTFEDRGDATWKDSYTKLLAFNQTQYKRVISLDSDAIVRQPMDELFLLPPSPIAMPRAYWLLQPFLSSQLAVITPSSTEMSRIEKHMVTNPKSGFDMDILNALYKDTALVLPHRAYDLLTSEFRKKPSEHEAYLGTQETWNATRVLDEAKFVHFSDWPVKKPWLVDEEGMREGMPACVRGRKGNERNCADRDVWLGLYEGYKRKRWEVCGSEYDGRKRRHVVEQRKRKKVPRRSEYSAG